MGDRVTVYVRVHSTHRKQAQEICDMLNYSVWEVMDGTDTVEIEMEGVNYADISDESKALTEAGIAHTYTWDKGGDFGAGEGYVIFNQHNQPVAGSYYDEDKNIPGTEILNLIRNGADVRRIENYVKEYMEKHSLPTIDDVQLKRGRIYRLKHIVTG